MRSRFLHIISPAEHLLARKKQTALDLEKMAQLVLKKTVRTEAGSGLFLFTGGSSDEKEMANAWISAATQLPLYRVNIATCLSKYVKESEKNISAVFSIATKNKAILFFDEGDALFGKRSEVRDANDRFATLKIDFIVTKLDAFAGPVIIGAASKSAIDAAFTRHLRFVVRFPAA